MEFCTNTTSHRTCGKNNASEVTLKKKNNPTISKEPPNFNDTLFNIAEVTFAVNQNVGRRFLKRV